MMLKATELKDLPKRFLEPLFYGCLLYTSDAADERSSVDLGGRRIIKKKSKCNLATPTDRQTDEQIDEEHASRKKNHNKKIRHI